MKTFDTLKHLLCRENDLNTVLHYFYDLDDDHIICQRSGHQSLEDVPHNGPYCAMLSAIRQGIDQRQQLALDAQHSQFRIAPADHFIHGTFAMQDVSIPVFYFNDIELGLYAIDRGHSTDVFRFSLVASGGLGLD